MTLFAAVALSVLSQSGIPTPSSALPPGHPAISGEAPPLPPDHPAVTSGGRAPPSADELIKQLDSQGGLQSKDKPFDIAWALARLYYSQARWKEAATYVSQAISKVDGADRLLAEQKRRGAAAPTQGDCGGHGSPGDVIFQTGKAPPPKGDASGASLCFFKVSQNVARARELRAQALYLSGDTTGAKAELDKVLAAIPGQDSSRLMRGILIAEANPDDKPGLERARSDFAEVA